MNILFITPRYPNEENGFANPFFKEQAESVSEHHSVTVVSAELNKNCFSIKPKYQLIESKSEGLIVHQLSICKSIPIYNSFNHAQVALKYIGIIIRSQKIDVIHCQNAFIAGYIGYLANKKYGIPYLITQHSYFSIDNDKLLQKQFNPVFKSKIHEMIIRKSFKKANRLIAVGEMLKNELEVVFNRPVDVVPNVIDTERFNLPRPSKKSGLKLGFVGNILYNKGLDVLFHALAKLKDRDFTLIIAGEGREKDSLIKLAVELGISDKVSFLGYINPIDLPQFYNGIDVFVLPSRRETFGVVVIEALSAGVPVITNPCGGPEYIINEDVGLLYEYCNPQSLCDALEKFAKTSDCYNPDIIKQYAKDNYSNSAFNKSISAIYSMVSKSKNTIPPPQ